VGLAWWGVVRFACLVAGADMTVAITRLEPTAVARRRRGRWSWTGASGRTRHGGVWPRLSAEQEAQVTDWLRKAPGLARNKVVRWRGADIQARIVELFGVARHKRGATLLHGPTQWRREPRRRRRVS